MELTPAQQKVLQHPMVKRGIVVCMFFMATRDILLSLALATVTLLCLEAFFNEGSRFCVLPKDFVPNNGSPSPTMITMPVVPPPITRVLQNALHPLTTSFNPVRFNPTRTP